MDLAPIPFGKPLFPPEEQVAEGIQRIWRSGRITNLGAEHRAFEDELRAYLKVPYLSLVSSGTAALTLALRAHGLNGAVLTSPFTFQATVNAIKLAGCYPVFVDIEPLTLCMDPQKTWDAMQQTGAKAILPVHMLGTQCDTAAFDEIGAHFQVPVIYDAAHAIGEGAGSHGAASCYSLHATKLLHAVEGGAIATSDPKLKAHIDSMRNHGLLPDGGFSGTGANAKLSEIHAMIGRLVLGMQDEERRKRKELDRLYLENLDGSFAKVPHPRTNHPSLQYFSIRVPDAAKLQRYLALQGIQTRMWPLVCDGWMPLPNAEKAASEMLSLPFYGDLGGENVRRICSGIQSFMEVHATHA